MAPTLRQRLLWRISIAQVLMWVCLGAAVIPVLVTVFRLFTLPSGPEGGFVGMGIMFLIFTWGPMLLFPLLGFVFTLDWKRKLEKELHGEDMAVEKKIAEPK